jgi:hypothetical protein
MTSDDDRHRDLNQPAPPAPSDLAILSAHPSLASLRAHGRLLDQLPTDSIAWAFVSALTAGFVVYGRAGAAVIITWTLLTIPITVLELLTRDLRRTCRTLNITRYGLLSMLFAIVALAATIGRPPALDSQTPSTTSAATSMESMNGPSSSEPSGAGLVPAGTSRSIPSSSWSP